ncbi:hypothetical protein JCM10213v2_004719 [Rhodosporidiobolus nylandii]
MPKRKQDRINPLEQDPLLAPSHHTTAQRPHRFLAACKALRPLLQRLADTEDDAEFEALWQEVQDELRALELGNPEEAAAAKADLVALFEESPVARGTHPSAPAAQPDEQSPDDEVDAVKAFLAGDFARLDVECASSRAGGGLGIVLEGDAASGSPFEEGGGGETAQAKVKTVPDVLDAWETGRGISPLKEVRHLLPDLLLMHKGREYLRNRIIHDSEGAADVGLVFEAVEDNMGKMISGPGGYFLVDLLPAGTPDQVSSLARSFVREAPVWVPQAFAAGLAQRVLEAPAVDADVKVELARALLPLFRVIAQDKSGAPLLQMMMRSVPRCRDGFIDAAKQNMDLAWDEYGSMVIKTAVELFGNAMAREVAALGPMVWEHKYGRFVITALIRTPPPAAGPRSAPSRRLLVSHFTADHPAFQRATAAGGLALEYLMQVRRDGIREEVIDLVEQVEKLSAAGWTKVQSRDYGLRLLRTS